MKTHLVLDAEELQVVKFALRRYNKYMMSRAKEDHIDMEPWLRDAATSRDIATRADILLDKMYERWENEA